MLQVCSQSDLAYAQGQALREMYHAMWTARDGAPQAISELAQDRDGTLWIGSESGLANFDGQTFRAFQSPPGDPEFPSSSIYSLLITKAGTLWVGFFEAGVARISAGRVTVFSTVETEPLTLVQQLREAPDGSIWAIANQRYLIRFGSDGTWRREATPLPTSGSTWIRYIGGIFVDSANTLWVAQGGVLHRRPLSQGSYTRTDVPAVSVTGFAETPSGDIWMNDYDWSGSRGRTQLVSPTGHRIRMLPQGRFTNGRVAYAADGSLIVASLDAGVRRFSLGETSLPPSHRSSADPDVFASEHGLSSNATRALILDSHGNIWIGGARGLDRLRPARLTRYGPATEATWSSLCASKQGEVWIASSSGELYSVSSRWRTLLPGIDGIRENVSSYPLACADGGHAWFANSSGVWTITSGRIIALPRNAGVDPNRLIKVVVASDLTLYATLSGPPEKTGSIWQFKDGQWRTLPREGELGAGGYTAYIDRRDRLWIGYTSGRAILHTAAGAQMFSSGEPGLGYVYSFHDTSRGLFAAGTNGLAVLRDSRFEMLAFAEPLFVRGVRGMVEAPNGDLWLNSASGFAHIPTTELEAGLANPLYPMKARLIREGDFAGAPQGVVIYVETAARDSEGHLLFATRNGIVRLDPKGSGASHAPIVTIRSMLADGQPVRDNRVLEAATRTLEIQYFGVNLTAPENVTYRYRLEGFDESWQEAGRRTEAIYTRLPPGTYTFGVMASNGDGVWTAPVLSAQFTVLPRFYQTRWFAAAMFTLGVLLVVGIYRLRVRQISRAMSARFEERLDERTRVARELHDTFLQTVHGSRLVAEHALKDPADHDRLVRAMQQVAVWLEQATKEGRIALKSLRASTVETNDLAEALRRAIEECSQRSNAEVSLEVNGDAREMHPVVRDEVYRIAYEAIRNAYIHSGGDRVEVLLEYAADLTLRICDNGMGIDAAVVEEGREGHFGLRGMRERAERIAGRLAIVTTPGSGTAITLVVPGFSVFRTGRKNRS